MRSTATIKDVEGLLTANSHPKSGIAGFLQASLPAIQFRVTDGLGTGGIPIC